MKPYELKASRTEIEFVISSDLVVVLILGRTEDTCILVRVASKSLRGFSSV